MIVIDSHSHIAIYIVTRIRHSLSYVIPHCGKRLSRGRAPDCQSRGRWFNPTYQVLPFRNLGNFVQLIHLPVSFGRDTKSCGGPFDLSGVYARGSKSSHTG